MSQNPETFDEVRRRRLARLGGASGNEATSPASPGSTSSATAQPPPPQQKVEAASGEKRRLEAKAEPAAAKAATTSVTHKPSSTPSQVDKMLRRCLRLTLGDDTPSLMGIPPSEVQGAVEMSSANVELVLMARVRRCAPTETALGLLSENFDRLQKEARNAKSRGYDVAEREMTLACEACVRLGARCLDEPGSLGPGSASSRETLAAALAEKSTALQPHFVRAILRSASDLHLVGIAAVICDVATSQLREERVSPVAAAAACSAVANFVAYAGKARGGAAIAAQPSFLPPPLEPAPHHARARIPGGLPGGLGGLFEAMAQAASAASGHMFETGTALGLAARAGNISHDETARDELAQLLQRPARGALSGKMRELTQRVAAVRDALDSLCSALVKSSPQSRDGALRWFAGLLARSADAEATVRDNRRIPSQTTRLNACAVLLRLCRPVVGDQERESNARADLAFLSRSDLGKAIFPADLTKVYSTEERQDTSGDAAINGNDDSDDEMYDDDDAGGEVDPELRAAIALSRGEGGMDMTTDSSGPTEFHFVTTLFFLTLRAVRLGLVCELLRYSEEQDTLGMHVRRFGLEDPRIQLAAAAGLALETQLLQDELLDDALRFSSWTCRWLLRLSDEELKQAPEHVLEDVAALPALVARFKPEVVRAAWTESPLADLLRLIAKCLSQRDRLVHSPHLRDKLANALYECYLPTAAQSDVFARPRGGLFGPLVSSTDPRAIVNADTNVALLLDDKSPAHLALAPALRALAPAILWLFGDAEHLGFYDVTPARLRVAALIRQLWTSPFHRAAFRAIAEDRSAFVTFANGLLNETNRLVASAMEKLPLVRDHQVRTGLLPPPDSNAELAQLREDYVNADQSRRDELDERFAEAERYLANDLKLCTETLGLVELLTSDDAVSNAFCLPELRPRLSGMLLSVMRAFTGRRSLDIKIVNPEKYGFDPKDILTRVGRVATHFARQGSAADSFAGALANSGYFETTLLPKTAATLRRIRTLDEKSLDALDALARDANAAYDTQVKYDAELEKDAPEEYVDQITCSLMTDPVKLPSGHICDSTTIKQHLLNEKIDPFSRMPLEESDLIPLPELRAEIEAWVQQQRDKRAANAAT